MSIADKQAAIVDELGALSDWQARYRRIIELGRELTPYPEEHRDEKHKVKGCQSQVWLHADLDDGRMRLWADSDAAIVRGLIAILVDVFDDEPPTDVAAASIGFIDDLGLSENLSATRANGLAAMIKQIKMYGVAFGALAARG